MQYIDDINDISAEAAKNAGYYIMNSLEKPNFEHTLRYLNDCFGITVINRFS